MQSILFLFSLVCVTTMQASAPARSSDKPNAVQLYNERLSLIEMWKKKFDSEKKVYEVYGEEKLNGAMYRQLDGNTVFQQGPQGEVLPDGTYRIHPEQKLAFASPKDAWRFYAYQSEYSGRGSFGDSLPDDADLLLTDAEKLVAAQDQAEAAHASPDLSLFTWLDERIKSKDEGDVFTGLMFSLKYKRDMAGKPFVKWMCVNPSELKASIDEALLQKAQSKKIKEQRVAIEQAPGCPAISAASNKE